MITWAWGLVRRRPGRLAMMASAVALLAALISSLGAFVVFARSDVSAKAAADVDVDWQVRLAPGATAEDALSKMKPVPGVRASEIVGYGDALALQTDKGGTVQTTGQGKVVGIGPGYRQTFTKQIRNLVGAPQGVLLAQQTAANLHAGPGDTVTVTLPGHPAEQFVVDGIVDLPNADPFFQTVGAGAGSSPQAPPDNVLIIPFDRWSQIFDPASGRGAIQVHVKLPRNLPSDPSKAYSNLVGIDKSYEVRMARGAAVGDNLASRLNAARSDSAYGSVLFLFLGLPGVAAGLALVWVAINSAAERRRAEQGLLAARGAGTRERVQAAAAEALLIWGAGSLAGIAVSTLVARVLWHQVAGSFWHWIAGAALTALAATLAAAIVPAWSDARRRSVSEARRTIGGKDLSGLGAAAGACLAVGAAVVVYTTTRAGYKVVLAPEGTPTISVSYGSLAGPALAWISGTLMLAWLAGRSLASGGRVIRRSVRPLAGGLSGLVAAWLMRLRPVVMRSVVLLAVAVAFAVSTSIFNQSFRAQSNVDAELTNGADVAAFAPQGVDLSSVLAQVRKLPGVAYAGTMQHRFAYVGNDLQDLYGIRPDEIARATAISDAYFAGGQAGRQLARLNAMPDGIFVSDETILDFQLKEGDSINLRMLDNRSHGYVKVPFHIAGVVREFPSAPTDSFLLANSSYVASMTHSGAAQTLLVKTSGSPKAVAGEVRNVLPPASGARVQDIVTQRKITATGLVAVDLSGLALVDLVFGSLVTLWALAMMLSIGVAERRQSFAVLRVLGAKGRQIAAFQLAEAGAVFVLGSLAGIALGGTVAWILVKVLQGVFDPPPQHLFIPWAYLGLLAVSLLAGAAAATGASLKRLDAFEVSWLRDQ